VSTLVCVCVLCAAGVHARLCASSISTFFILFKTDVSISQFDNLEFADAKLKTLLSHFSM